MNSTGQYSDEDLSFITTSNGKTYLQKLTDDKIINKPEAYLNICGENL